jgi:hypothetical protein
MAEQTHSTGFSVKTVLTPFVAIPAALILALAAWILFRPLL